MILRVDERERNIEFGETELNISIQRETLKIGDYIIDNNGPLHCFERKTFDDFIASNSDGRLDNLEKMIKLREATGCRLSIIFEHDNFFFSRYKKWTFKRLHSMLNKFDVCYNINTIYTKGLDETASTLLNYCKHYTGVYGSGPAPKIDVSKPIDYYVKQMWCKINGVGVESAQILIRHSFKEVLKGFEPEIKAKEIKKGLNKKVIQVKILTTIKGVSKLKAVEILKHYELIDLCKRGRLDNFTINGRKIKKLAEQIRCHLTYTS